MLDPPRRAEEDSRPIVFEPCPQPTVGVELELSLIDPETRLLAPDAPALLADVDDPRVKPELFQTIVEVNTGVCKDIGEVRADLSERLERVQAAAQKRGLGLLCTGTHPFASWRNLPITDDERYTRLVETMQWPARRLLICGVHVHVGLPSGEHAVAITNAMACFIPHFLALSASSPFWGGRDTGLASSRSKVFEGLPTAGLPPRITNWAEFVALMRTLLGAGTITSIREIWWDIRPHPGFGTVELRMCDGINTVDEICAIAAFAQCFVSYFVDLYDNGESLPLLKRWTLAENKWRASRWAEQAMLIRNEHGEVVPLAEHVEEWLDHLRPTAARLGCEDDLDAVRRILEHGPSYQRQRARYAETGSLEAVVDTLVEELQEDRPWRAASKQR